MLDRLLGRLYHLETFSPDPECILRVAARPVRTTTAIALDGGMTLEAGVLVVEVHFANAKLPKPRDNGIDLAWARRFERSLRHSLTLLAAELLEDTRFREFAALHGVLGFLPADDLVLRRRLAERFGFILQLRAAPGRAWWRASFWSVVYLRWLAWAFNPASLRGKDWRRSALTDLWMTRETLLRRCGQA